MKMTFTVKEVAEITGQHPETIRIEIREGNLEAAKPGRGYRVSRPELERYWRSKGGKQLFPGQTEKEAETLARED